MISKLINNKHQSGTREKLLKQKCLAFKIWNNLTIKNALCGTTHTKVEQDLSKSILTFY